MLHLCVDRGNSYTKFAVFDNNQIIYEELLQSTDEIQQVKNILTKYPIDNSIISSVVDDNAVLKVLLENASKECIDLTYETDLPITNVYQTPQTLGKDRLAAVIGAFSLKPNTDILVIDIGTAITYDFIDASAVYHGGNISPGVDLRLKALHHLTDRLPLVDFEIPTNFLGNSTLTAIQSGVFYGISLEVNGYIDHLLLNYPKLSVFLTGGYAVYFDNQLKNRIFADKNLVLIGLNRILHYNVQNN